MPNLHGQRRIGGRDFIAQRSIAPAKRILELKIGELRNVQNLRYRIFTHVRTPPFPKSESPCLWFGQHREAAAESTVPAVSDRVP